MPALSRGLTQPGLSLSIEMVIVCCLANMKQILDFFFSENIRGGIVDKYLWRWRESPAGGDVDHLSDPSCQEIPGGAGVARGSRGSVSSSLPHCSLSVLPARQTNYLSAGRSLISSDEFQV